MDSKNIHTHIPKPCLHKNNKINRTKIPETKLSNENEYETIQELENIKENVVQSNFYLCPPNHN